MIWNISDEPIMSSENKLSNGLLIIIWYFFCHYGINL
jgi:hypothetical protein